MGTRSSRSSTLTGNLFARRCATHSAQHTHVGDLYTVMLALSAAAPDLETNPAPSAIAQPSTTLREMSMTVSISSDRLATPDGLATLRAPALPAQSGSRGEVSEGGRSPPPRDRQHISQSP